MTFVMSVGLGVIISIPHWSPVWDWEKQCQSPTPDQEWGIETFFSQSHTRQQWGIEFVTPNPTLVTNGGLKLLLPIPHL